MVNDTDQGLPPTPPTDDSGDQPGAPGAPGGAIDEPAAQDAPVGLRVGRNPANLGDEVPETGDVTYPAPVPEAVPQI